jgi:hypothetical protein
MHKVISRGLSAIGWARWADMVLHKDPPEVAWNVWLQDIESF